MKLLVKIVLAVSIALVYAGCKTGPETIAYKTIGSTATAVDGAMKGWADWVVAGKATPEDEIKVKAAYEKYQAAMRSAKALVAIWRNNPAAKPDAEKAISLASETSSAFVTLVTSTINTATVKP